MTKSRRFALLCLLAVLPFTACDDDDTVANPAGGAVIAAADVEGLLEETVLPALRSIFFVDVTTAAQPLAVLEHTGERATEECHASAPCSGGGNVRFCALSKGVLEVRFDSCVERGETADGTIRLLLESATSATVRFDLSVGETSITGEMAVGIDELAACITETFTGLSISGGGRSLNLSGSVQLCAAFVGPEGQVSLTATGPGTRPYRIEMDFNHEGTLDVEVWDDATGELLYVCDVDLVAGAAECLEVG